MNPFTTQTRVSPSALAEFNTRQLIARHTYAADEAVRAGMCATCGVRKRDGTQRRCWSCRVSS